jgi:hypothetical protein
MERGKSPPAEKVVEHATGEPEATGGDDGYLAPRDAAEARLCTLWQEILQVERVGVHDNFFELGGDSLRAFALISRLAVPLEFESVLRALFEQQTVAGLCAWLAEQAPALGAMTAAPQSPALGATPEADPSRAPAWFAELAAALGGTVERGRQPPAAAEPAAPVDLQPPALSYEQEEYYLDFLRGLPLRKIPLAFRIEGPLELEPLARTLRELVRRHEALRTTIGTIGGQVSQVIHDDFELVLHQADLADEPDPVAAAHRERVMAARLAGDPERGPVVWAKLLRLGPEEHTLLITANHICLDGWSLQVLGREAAALYQAFKEARPSPLAPPALQYRGYAAWRRNRMRGEVLEQHFDYWRQQLLDEPVPQLRLPTDRPRGASPPSAASVPVTLAPDLIASVKKWSGREGTSLFPALLAAFGVVLGHHGGQDDVSIATLFANRNGPGVESLVGMCATPVILRTKVSPGATASQLMRRVHQILLGAQQHQSLPPHRIMNRLAQEGRGEAAREALNPRCCLLLFTRTADVEIPPPPGLAIEWLANDQAIMTAADDRLDETDDLTVVLSETESGGLAGTFAYRGDLFDEARIAELVEQVVHVLQQFVARPSAPLSSVAL